MTRPELLTLLAAALLLAPPCGATPPQSANAAGAEARARFGATAKVRWDAARGAARGLFGLQATVSGADDATRARRFIRQHADLLGGPRDAELALAGVAPNRAGAVVRFNQMVDGLQVADRSVAVRLDTAGRVRSVQSDYARLVMPPGAVDIGPEAARQVASAALGGAPAGTPWKAVFASLDPRRGAVAYRVTVAPIVLVVHRHVWVRASDGAILAVRPGLRHARRGGAR